MAPEKISNQTRLGDYPAFRDWNPGTWKMLETYYDGPLNLSAINQLLDPQSAFFGQAVCTPDSGEKIFKALKIYLRDLLEAQKESGNVIRGADPEDAKDLIKQQTDALYGIKPPESSDETEFPF